MREGLLVGSAPRLAAQPVVAHGGGGAQSLDSLIRDDHVVGVTTNPSIFASALSTGNRYDADLQALAEEGAESFYSGALADGLTSVPGIDAGSLAGKAIAAPAERVWEVVGRPELLHLWFPGIVDCTVEGDQRTITLATGMSLDETILTNDPLQRRFQYRISGGFFREHLGSIDVIPLGERRCLVTYASDVDPATMAIVLGGATAGALTELRRQLEGGT